tara:strand:- start:3088 stop:3279 length:192 start_codon:yes stop_codon:yes gene_type:complete
MTKFYVKYDHDNDKLSETFEASKVSVGEAGELRFFRRGSKELMVPEAFLVIAPGKWDFYRMVE